MGRPTDLHHLITIKTTTSQNHKPPLHAQMAQAIASTAKAVGIGVGSLSIIAYLALWGGQRQVTLPPPTPPDFVLSLMLSCEKLAYPSNFPAGSRTDVPNPYDEYGITYEDLYLPTPDGEKLHAFMMLQDSPRDKKTVFICHANAGNMGHRVPICAKLYKSYGWNVFIFSYRG